MTGVRGQRFGRWGWGFAIIRPRRPLPDLLRRETPGTCRAFRFMAHGAPVTAGPWRNPRRAADTDRRAFDYFVNAPRHEGNQG